MTSASGGPDDNEAQAGHLLPVALHLTQDPITETDLAMCIGAKGQIGAQGGQRA